MAEDNDNDNGNSSIDPSELDDEMLEKLMDHPEVRKFVEYNETGIPEATEHIAELLENEDFEDTLTLFVEGIADRSGRVTEQTVRKVLNGFVEEYRSVAE